MNEDVLEEQLEREGKRLGLKEDRTLVAIAFLQLDGTVEEVRIESSSGNYFFDVAATQILKSAKFTPAMIEGIRLRVGAKVPLSYSRQ